MRGTASALRSALVLLLPGAWAAGACSGSDPSQPVEEVYVLQTAGGDLQFAEVGADLPQPLRVSIRTVSGDVPNRDLEVDWTVVEGSGATLERATTPSPSGTGLATNSLKLGSTPGLYRVRASLESGAEAEFEAYAVTTPVLDAVPGGPVTAGDVITLTGSNFSEVAAHDLVLFDGIRGRVVSAATGTLEVEVPPCLPTRRVEVRVALGGLQSGGRSLDVQAAGPVTSFAVGEVRDVDPTDGSGCTRLPGGSYLAVALSAGRVGGGLYDFSLRAVAPGVVAAPEAVSPPRLAADGGSTAQERWDARLRDLEAGLTISGGPEAAPRSAAASGAVPALGDRREFEVLNGDNSFDKVQAVVKYVGARAVLYVDVKAPSGGLGDTDLENLFGLFDETIEPAVTEAFGSPSDLDGNGRVAVLFTPVVNRLTEPGSDGFVGGFFYGLDLLPTREHSNGGEIFYALVADPQGDHGVPITRDQVLQSLPSILAHEFEHMVHFNQRILVAGASSTEAVWLSEGLAHMAEDVVAQARAEGGQVDPRFLRSNDERARRFLRSPSDVSLIIAQGQGNLGERGAEWLFVRYLDEQEGRDVLARLCRTTLTGAENVESVTGTPWERLLSDWLSAIYTDGRPVGTGPLEYPDLDIRGRLSEWPGGYPLAPPKYGPGGFRHEDDLLSSSGDHVLVDVGPGGLALALAATTGAAPSPTARFRLRIVRMQ